MAVVCDFANARNKVHTKTTVNLRIISQDIVLFSGSENEKDFRLKIVVEKTFHQEGYRSRKLLSSSEGARR